MLKLGPGATPTSKGGSSSYVDIQLPYETMDMKRLTIMMWVKCRDTTGTVTLIVRQAIVLINELDDFNSSFFQDFRDHELLEKHQSYLVIDDGSLELRLHDLYGALVKFQGLGK